MAEMRLTAYIYFGLVGRENHSPNRVDSISIISAEVSNQEENSKLLSTVNSSVLHGPCGVLNIRSPCMKDSECTKKYQRKLLWIP